MDRIDFQRPWTPKVYRPEPTASINTRRQLRSPRTHKEYTPKREIKVYRYLLPLHPRPNGEGRT